MCLAVPGKIVAVEADTQSPLGGTATVDFQGSRVEASLAMTPDAGVGDWVLVHAGFTISVLDEAEAMETWAALQEALGSADPADDGEGNARGRE